MKLFSNLKSRYSIINGIIYDLKKYVHLQLKEEFEEEGYSQIIDFLVKFKCATVNFNIMYHNTIL